MKTALVILLLALALSISPRAERAQAAPPPMPAAQVVSPIWRFESWVASQLVERLELERISGLVTFRRYDGNLVLTLQRDALPAEIIVYAAFEDSANLANAEARLKTAYSWLNARSTELQGYANNWAAMTAAQRTAGTGAVMAEEGHG